MGLHYGKSRYKVSQVVGSQYGGLIELLPWQVENLTRIVTSIAQPPTLFPPLRPALPPDPDR